MVILASQRRRYLIQDITYRRLELGSSGISASSGTFSWTVPDNPSTKARVRVVDSQNESIFDISAADFVIEAAPVNNPPVFSSNPFSRPNPTEGVFYSETIAGHASDPDGDPMTFSKVGGPGWLNVASNGALTGTPGSADLGLNIFTVRVEDNRNGSDEATLNITVNEPPNEVAIAGSWTSGLNHATESGSNRVLLFITHVEHGSAISLNSVSYDGQPMTRVTDFLQGSSFRAYTAAFMLDEVGISAAIGNAFSPSWSASPSNAPGYSSVFLTGVDQAVPIGDSDAGGANLQATVATPPLQTAAGDMVIAAGTSGKDRTPPTTDSPRSSSIPSLPLTASSGTNSLRAATKRRVPPNKEPIGKLSSDSSFAAAPASRRPTIHPPSSAIRLASPMRQRARHAPPR